MAIYKGREVQLLGRVDGADVSPVYRVLDPYGYEEQVQLSDLYLTSDEKKDFDKQGTETQVNVISDKDLQDLRDSQDVEKIKAKQAQEDTDVTVPVSEIKVDKDAVK